jgi:hypothetical protein
LELVFWVPVFCEPKFWPPMLPLPEDDVEGPEVADELELEEGE